MFFLTEVKSKAPKQIIVCPKEIEIKVVLGNNLTKEFNKNIAPVVKEKRKKQNTRRTSSKYFKKSNLVSQGNCCIEQNVIDGVATTDGNSLLTSNYFIQKKKAITEELTSTDIENVELVNLSPKKVNSQINVSCPEESIVKDNALILADHKDTLQQVNVSANNSFLKKEPSPLCPKATLREDQQKLESGNKENLEQVNLPTDKNNFQEKDLSTSLLKVPLREDQQKLESENKENLEHVTCNSSTDKNNFQEKVLSPSLLKETLIDNQHQLQSENNKENLEQANSSTEKNNTSTGVQEKDLSPSLPKESFKELNKPTSNCVENLEPVTLSATSKMNSFFEKELSLPLSNEAGSEEDMLTSNCKESADSFHLHVHTSKNLYSSLHSTVKNDILANVTEMEVSDSHSPGKCDNYSDILREKEKPETLNAEAESKCSI